MVTEGYTRVPPPPPTVGVSTACRPLPDGVSTACRRLPCNLQCILRVGFKNIVFYGVSGPSPATAAILAMLKNVGFFMVLGSREGKKTEKSHLEGFST